MTIRLVCAALIGLWAQSASAGFFDLAPQPVPYPAPDVQFSSQSKMHTLADYKGKKVMLWMFSTWCHTCVAGLHALQKQQAILKNKALAVLAIRNYNNGGYPGVRMPEFIDKFAPALKKEKNWVFGEASQAMYQQINAKKYPDIYFLIDEKGMVQTVSTAPNASMDKIMAFIKGGNP